MIRPYKTYISCCVGGRSWQQKPRLSSIQQVAGTPYNLDHGALLRVDWRMAHFLGWQWPLIRSNTLTEKSRQVSVACSTDMMLFGYDQGVFGKLLKSSLW